MANWFGAARTNYFRVRDPEAFAKWARACSLSTLRLEQIDLWAVVSETDTGAWPSSVEDPEVECGYRHFDLITELLTHVMPGEVVVCVEVGARSVHRLSANATAFKAGASPPDQITFSLDDIYLLAEAQWGVLPNQAAF